MPTDRFHEGSAFDPEAIVVIAAAFEDACRMLYLEPEDPRREQVARRIFACALSGERDAMRLREAGLATSVSGRD